MSWAATELQHAHLGDKRLNRRLATLVEAFARHAEASIPQALPSWAATKAAYRFFENERHAQGDHRDACAGCAGAPLGPPAHPRRAGHHRSELHRPRRHEGLGYELFAQERPEQAQWLVRAAQNRCTRQGERLFEVLAKAPVAGHSLIQLGRRGEQPPREARLELRYGPVRLLTPKDKPSLAALEVTGILVEEEAPVDQSAGCKLRGGHRNRLLLQPTLQEALRMIAKLGGFLGRRGDGEPGVKVLWRGMRRLNDIAETWLRARSLAPPPLVRKA